MLIIWLLLAVAVVVAISQVAVVRVVCALLYPQQVEAELQSQNFLFPQIQCMQLLLEQAVQEP